ncbi:MAG: hypothetical protein RJB38_84 [Pseudomonadota bacterium]|jgi:rhodanese-related sulfurtransferase
MRKIGMLDLKGVIGKLGANEVILDVRGADEFREGHLPGARNIPHDHVIHHLDELRQLKAIYIHCHAGRRAGMAAEALEKAGLTNLVCVLGGGMGDWIAAGFPVET